MLSDWRILQTFNGSIRRYLIAWALISFSYFGIQSVLLNLYLLRLGFGPAFIGMLTASGQLIWAVAALPAGAVARRVGLRTALVAGSAFLALAMGALLLVEALPRAMWTFWLFGSWALLWVGAALTTVNSTPYLMQVSREEERNHAFVAQSAVMAMTGFAGSLAAGVLPQLVVNWLGGSLDQPAPYHYALWLVPLLYAICIAVWAGARPVRLVASVRRATPHRGQPACSSFSGWWCSCKAPERARCEPSSTCTSTAISAYQQRGSARSSV